MHARLRSDGLGRDNLVGTPFRNITTAVFLAAQAVLFGSRLIAPGTVSTAGGRHVARRSPARRAGVHTRSRSKPSGFEQAGAII